MEQLTAYNLTRDLQDKHQQFDLLMKHFADISEPYEYEKENATTGEIEIVKKLSDCVGSDRSLIKLVKVFLSQVKRGDPMDATVLDEN